MFSRRIFRQLQDTTMRNVANVGMTLGCLDGSGTKGTLHYWEEGVRPYSNRVFAFVTEKLEEVECLQSETYSMPIFRSK